MKSDIIKLCADSVRDFAMSKYGVKLKASHAHELAVAYAGYPSKNAMLADRKYPINNLPQAQIVVMVPDTFIDERRKKLKGLPLELPDSYRLGEAVYASLFSDDWWTSPYPPFRSFEKLAKHIVESNDAIQQALRFQKDLPRHHIVDVKATENGMLITVLHSHETPTREMLVDGKTTIKLPRVAGHIGYGQAHVSFEMQASDT